MKGLEEAKKLYEEKGEEMIRREFPEAEGRIAVGLVGHGSECFGYDDGFSRDHDFSPGFCLWLSDGDSDKIAPRLARAYRSILPEGKSSEKSAMSERSKGVQRTTLFYRRYTGSGGAPASWQQWLAIPSYALAEATNGQVWRDDLGEFSAIRQQLLYGMPEDVRKKKIAARAVSMAQSGQYNYLRCIKHGETAGAQLAADEFVRSTAEMIFLLNRAHAPYYKWLFRRLRELSKLSDMAYPLEAVLTGENEAKLKAQLIEDICANVIKELKAQKLTDSSSDYMEMHAFEVQERIENREIRALHIMEG